MAAPYGILQGVKRCSKCGEEKSLENFARRKDSPDGHRNHCKDCRRDYMREYEPKWRAANPDKVKAKFARWVAAHPEQERERCNRYDATNREKRRHAIAQSRKDNPKHHRALDKAWRAANPAKARDIWYRWYEGTQNPTPETVAYIDVLLNDPCSYCGGPMKDIDHIKARSRGGEHDWTNLTASCRSCNPSKGNRKLLVWLAGR
jgi:5-methylcytosine-specific restriction endonuclease McrA